MMRIEQFTLISSEIVQGGGGDTGRLRYSGWQESSDVFAGIDQSAHNDFFQLAGKNGESLCGRICACEKES